MLFIYATSLAKAEALSHLHVDMISYDVEICLVAETWLKQNKHPDSMFNVDGFSLLRQDRSKRKGAESWHTLGMS